MTRQPISELKNNLESKHRELVKIKNKARKLAEQSSESLSHSDKTRIENSLHKLKPDLKSLEKEIDELKKEIYGSWAPSKNK